MIFFKNKKLKSEYIVRGDQNLEVRSTPGKGRGVFTTKPINKKSLIEECPVLMIEIETLAQFNGLKMGYYVFKIKDQPGKAALLLGFGSLYNHACPANAETYYNTEKMTFEVIAVRTIKKDEEITINYNGSYDNEGEINFLENIEEANERSI